MGEIHDFPIVFAGIDIFSSISRIPGVRSNYFLGSVFVFQTQQVRNARTKAIVLNGILTEETSAEPSLPHIKEDFVLLFEEGSYLIFLEQDAFLVIGVAGFEHLLSHLFSIKISVIHPKP